MWWVEEENLFKNSVAILPSFGAYTVQLHLPRQNCICSTSSGMQYLVTCVVGGVLSNCSMLMMTINTGYILVFADAQLLAAA